MPGDSPLWSLSCSGRWRVSLSGCAAWRSDRRRSRGSRCRRRPVPSGESSTAGQRRTGPGAPPHPAWPTSSATIHARVSRPARTFPTSSSDNPRSASPVWAFPRTSAWSASTTSRSPLLRPSPDHHPAAVRRNGRDRRTDTPVDRGRRRPTTQPRRTGARAVAVLVAAGGAVLSRTTRVVPRLQPAVTQNLTRYCRTGRAHRRLVVLQRLSRSATVTNRSPTRNDTVAVNALAARYDQVVTLARQAPAAPRLTEARRRLVPPACLRVVEWLRVQVGVGVPAFAVW